MTLKNRSQLFTEYLHEASTVNALWRAFEYSRFSEEKLQKPVLDLGCGDGYFASHAFSEKIDVGLDINKKELFRAYRRGCYRELVQGDATSLPFADNRFKAVISNCVLEHIDGIDKALEEIRRVLKPGGCLFMTVPSEYYGYYYGKSGRAMWGGKTLKLILNSLFHHCYVDHWQVWEQRFQNVGLVLVKSEYLIPRKAFNTYLRWFILAAPSKMFRSFSADGFCCPGLGGLKFYRFYSAISLTAKTKKGFAIF